MRAKVSIVGEHSLQSSTLGVGAEIIKSDKSAMGAKNIEAKQMQWVAQIIEQADCLYGLY